MLKALAGWLILFTLVVGARGDQATATTFSVAIGTVVGIPVGVAVNTVQSFVSSHQ